MGQITLSEEIAAPLDDVFAVAIDLPRAAEHITGIDQIELLTPLPVGQGTRWRETRTMFGRASTEELAVTGFDPPRGYTISSESCGARIDCRFSFAPVNEHTLVTLAVDWRAVSMFAKLMTPLSAMMSGPMEKAMRQDLEDLKRAAEARAANPQ